MAQNIGTLVGAAIRPLTDTMPIASAYATEIKGGLHFATSSTDRDAIIQERRDWGMMCYVINDYQTYQLQYNLLNPGGTNIMDNNNWEVFSGSGTGGGLDIKYYVEPSDNILVPQYYQYWIYGDLTIAGNFVNYGQVVIANGGLVMSGGSFSNYGSIAFVSLIAGTVTPSFNDSDTIGYTVQNTIFGPSVSSFVLPNSLTASVLSSIGGPTAGYLLSVDSNGIFNWVNPIGGGLMSGVDKNYIMSYDTIGDGQFTGLTLSGVPIGNSYISVYINGQEIEVGDGSTMSSCYFSNDYGSTAKDFVGVNSVQSGDGLYWNGFLAGFDLYTSWRISVHYLV